MKRFMVGLILAIPLSSVIVCIILFTLAATGHGDLLPEPANPISKTSWKNPQ